MDLLLKNMKSPANFAISGNLACVPVLFIN
ncbi:predicted protein [Sclerotinia sclerotiorum 1980 UF-70]|uniref:Uncharacterized protein n=1 Tax=Sclerotinia sclerotiorum (strain ATCC 18683 / 1980 / Ss-1) TaxID=665079 RepID=A7E6J7_SCLS1|nr:predicted protein [Sclerotinia sclerotiorum 1980 UF-70]EDN91519.1 predicted protein [Sclerotinia sclerotiorum 1980 UF-70]